MRIRYLVREPASFFHVLDSLSAWDIHTRGHVRACFVSRYPLTAEDRKSLNTYTAIRRNYPWATMDSDFALAADMTAAYRAVRKRVTAQEYQKIKSVFLRFYPRITSLIREQRSALDRRKRQLELLQAMYPLASVFKEMQAFLGVEQAPKRLDVHLLFNPSKERAGGGANIRPPENITLEPHHVSGNARRDVKADFAVILHESFHVLERYMPAGTRDSVRNQALAAHVEPSILREAIADTLVPGGYLAKHYGLSRTTVLQYKNIHLPKRDDRGRYYLLARRLLSAKIYPHTRNQIRSGKSLLEGEYLDQCIKLAQSLGIRAL